MRYSHLFRRSRAPKCGRARGENPPRSQPTRKRVLGRETPKCGVSACPKGAEVRSADVLVGESRDASRPTLHFRTEGTPKCGIPAYSEGAEVRNADVLVGESGDASATPHSILGQREHRNAVFLPVPREQRSETRTCSW